MVNNIVISIFKIYLGIIFNISSLFSDGLHSFSDFLTDVMSLVGNKISKKRANKTYPFGFGKVEYLTNLYIGIILLLIGIFVIYHSFQNKTIIPSLNIIYYLLIIIFMKSTCIFLIKHVAKEENNKILYTSAEESMADLYSTIGVVLIIVLLNFSKYFSILRYSDLVGTIFIGFYIVKTAYHIIVHNSLALIGQIDSDEEINNNIKKILNKFSDVTNNDFNLIKYGAYYKLELNITVKPNMSLKSLSSLEKKIKTSIIRNTKYKIRFITIYLQNK